MKPALSLILILFTCLPFVLCMLYLRENYPPDTSLTDIGLKDGILLLISLSLPFVLLRRSKVYWRKPPAVL